MQLQEQFEHVGVIFANLYNWKTSNVKAIRFSTLEAICETLNGQPGDILGLLGFVFGLLNLLGLLGFYKYAFSHHGWLVRGDCCRHLYTPQKRWTTIIYGQQVKTDL